MRVGHCQLKFGDRVVERQTVEEAGQIKNTEIVEELNLPPVKIHCSVLAEDAIKGALNDYKKKAELKSQQEETAASAGS